VSTAAPAVADTSSNADNSTDGIGATRRGLMETPVPNSTSLDSRKFPCSTSTASCKLWLTSSMKSELSPAASLPEVHGTVSTARPTVMRRMLAFAGPAYLVSVGYMDPGNWATDLEGGARFGYRLLWVLLLSNAMAILLQTLAARLGIVAGRDLAQACRESYSRPLGVTLWVLCEIAIAACDLAEVIGTVVGLKLLFGMPYLWGLLLTTFDT